MSTPFSSKSAVRTGGGIAALLTCSAITCVAIAGCGRMHSKSADRYVYVTAKQANLRDRVAAVSNRTGQVSNGDRLKVLERGRHSVRVETDKGQVGWIEEKMIATSDAADAFEQLTQQHKDDPDVGTAVVRDQVYMHVKPGRDSERFYLLNEGDKLKLLRRASLQKLASAAVSRAMRPIPQAPGSNAAKKSAEPAPAPAEPPTTVMEDWWLVKDAAGHAGWIYARMIDVDAPESLTRYAEGQRIVASYILSRVHDDGAPGGPADVPVYVALFSPFKAGLTYDFDQVRVFTWSLSHHRYETAFRNKNVEGYLPVTIERLKDPSLKGALGQEELPAFSYKVLAADAPPVISDPATGEMKPTKTITKTFRLEGSSVRRLGSAAGAPWAAGANLEAHPVPEETKEKKGRKKH